MRGGGWEGQLRRCVSKARGSKPEASWGSQIDIIVTTVLVKTRRINPDLVFEAAFGPGESGRHYCVLQGFSQDCVCEFYPSCSSGRLQTISPATSQNITWWETQL